MTRTEAEKRIAELAWKIHEVHKEYNPNAGYLSLSFCHSQYGLRMFFNNEDWNADAKYPLDYTEVKT